MKVAYCFSAEGEDYIRMMKYSEHCLKSVIPDAEIIEIGREALAGLYEGGDAIWYTHLAIPLDKRFDGYDKVVFLDADCEVVKPEFASFFNFGDDVEVWGKPCHRFCRPTFEYWDINQDRPQLNGGCVGYNLANIDKPDWRRRLTTIINYPHRNHLPSRDEGWLFFMTNPEMVSDIYNNEWGFIHPDTTMIHHRSLRRGAYMERVNKWWSQECEASK